MFSAIDILDIAIQIEENGCRIYEAAVERQPQTAISDLLRWMAKEEKRHAKFFQQLQKKVPNVEADQQTAEMGRRLLQEVVKSQTFSLNSAKISEASDIRHFLTMAIEFEKDTLLFYDLIENFLEDPDALLNLQKVISEERQHVGQLEELLQNSFSAELED